MPACSIGLSRVLSPQLVWMTDGKREPRVMEEWGCRREATTSLQLASL